MPNGHGPKEYGGHKYAKHDGTSNCEYGCGCWVGPARSGGPTGLDPFGTCPQNPKDGKTLGGTADYDYVVTERIKDLTALLHNTQERLRRVSPSKIQLADKFAAAETELAEKNRLLNEVRRIIEIPQFPGPARS